ncbi:hypothetical protein F5Y09DRAFT_352256 [Xylaria sp. FL1042]|nr:hypothetical protein F5Y09DRAFT_352256 [Xylaria sp. FL1042]
MHSYEAQRRAMPPPPLNSASRSLRRTDRAENGSEFLDRWSSWHDRNHDRRVQLYLKRKSSIARYQQRQGLHYTRPMSAHAGEIDNVRSLNSYDSDHTPLPSPASSIAFSDLGSTFKNELDYYDNQIETLQKGEWPAPPNPREKALRMESKNFSTQTAMQLKQWFVSESFMFGRTSASLRDTDGIHPAARYRVGVIFSAPHHTASTDDSRWVSSTDPHNTATPFGVVHSKFRKMVVVKVFGEHCTCLPIYSYNGRGLEGKGFITEYVSIRDAKEKYPEPPEGLHPMLLAVGNKDFRGQVVAGKSTVKLTEFYSHRYDAPATMEGRLEWTSQSKRRLLELVKFLNS